MFDEGRDVLRASARRFRSWAALLSIVLAGALLLLYTVAVRTHTGQVADLAVYRLSHLLNYGGGISETIRSALHLPLLTGYLLVAVMAIRARRWRQLVVSLAVLAATPAVSRWLRDAVFDRPFLGEHDFVMNTLPSGHVSLSAALAVAIVMLWPSRARWPILAAGAVVTAASLASVVGHAHRPSDVVASALLTGSITCAVLALGGPLAAPQMIRRAVPTASTTTGAAVHADSPADDFRREGSARSTGQRKSARPARRWTGRSDTRPSRRQ